MSKKKNNLLYNSMSRVSNYVKVNPSVLLEYIYDNGNLIADQYNVLFNSSTNQQSYEGGTSSVTNNTQLNSIFQLNPVTNTYALIDPSTYNFIQLKNYSSGVPNQHDILRIHFPTNYTFGENIGCYVRIYTLDVNNQFIYELSNFYFDMTNTSTIDLMNFSAPPLYFQETLWSKYLEIDFPSIYAISNQLTGNSPTPNSINYNLTNGVGLSLTAPVFVDFRFLSAKNIINGITTYILSAPVTISVPQQPSFQNIGVMIQEADDGDYFQIFGTLNGDIGDFNTFVTNAVNQGNNYYAQFTITLWEQNIKGNSLVVNQTQDFGTPLEYRPIIKISTTTAIIDVQMSLIDVNTNASITRQASYGMLQNEVSKYSMYLTKINLANANKPIIYNVKNPIDPTSLLNSRTSGNPNSLSTSAFAFPEVQIQTVQVPFPVMIDRYNIISKSDTVTVGSAQWYGIGKLQIMIYPFDNVFKIIIATSVDTTNSQPSYMDLSNMGTINMIIKNTQFSTSFNLYTDTGEVNLNLGFLVFKIPSSSINDIRKIYNSGVNLFYITTSSNNITTVIYTGIFQLYDSTQNVSTLNNTVQQAQTLSSSNSYIISDNSTAQKATAVVTRVLSAAPTTTSSSLPNLSNSTNQSQNPQTTTGTGKVNITPSNTGSPAGGVNPFSNTANSVNRTTEPK